MCLKITVNSTFDYFAYYLNYGSVLQAYALQKYLIQRGHTVDLIQDYRTNKRALVEEKRNVGFRESYEQKRKAQKSLIAFAKKYIHLTSMPYYSGKQFKLFPPKADCHIVGSDQVWQGEAPFRYLNYVPEDKVKLSYAASFGKNYISKDMEDKIKPFLMRFDGISVREQTGVSIINNMGLQGIQSIDPTLLIEVEDYPVKQTEEMKNIALCYFLNLSGKNDVPYQQFKAVCKKKGWQTKMIVPLNYMHFTGEELYFPTVEEWLGSYSQAKAVITNTFHGMMFCIIFRKQFLLCIQNGNNVQENDRFFTVLNLFGLMERVITPDISEEELEQRLEAPIDYALVYESIQKKREETDLYFKKYGI